MPRDRPAYVVWVQPFADFPLSEMTAARPEKNPEAMSGGAIQGSGSSAGYCWSDPWQGTEEEAFMHQPEPAARSYVSRMRSVRQAVVRFGAIACTFEEISRAKFFATKP